MCICLCLILHLSFFCIFLFLSVSWPLHLSVSGVKNGREDAGIPAGIPDKIQWGSYSISVRSQTTEGELGSWEQVELGIGRNVGRGSLHSARNAARALHCAPRTREPSSQLSLTPQGSSIQQMSFSVSLDPYPWLQLRMSNETALRELHSHAGKGLNKLLHNLPTGGQGAPKGECQTVGPATCPGGEAKQEWSL